MLTIFRIMAKLWVYVRHDMLFVSHLQTGPKLTLKPTAVPFICSIRTMLNEVTNKADRNTLLRITTFHVCFIALTIIKS